MGLFIIGTGIIAMTMIFTALVVYAIRSALKL